jgi:DNA mismatch repair protein MutL
MPEVYPLAEAPLEILKANGDVMAKFGIFFEELASDMILIKALPAILESSSAKPVMDDIIDDLLSFGNAHSMEEKIHSLLSTISCHSSLRAGAKLSKMEMNGLLNQMKNTENIAQCCHGRPSYIILSMEKLNKFFERS